MDKILDAVIDIVESKLHYHITKGATPKGDKIAMYIGAGSPACTYQDKGAYSKLYVTLNGKNKEQDKAIQNLERIHQYLSKLKSYPIGIGWQVINICTSSTPSLIGQEENGFYMYGSILQIDYYIYGGK